MLEDAYKELDKKSKQPENELNGVKFIEEELNQLKEIRNEYVNVQNQLGQLSVTKIRVEQQWQSLLKAEDDFKNRYKETQDKEQEFVSSIIEKYGDGQLDISTGIFIKDEDEVEKVENNEK